MNFVEGPRLRGSHTLAFRTVASQHTAIANLFLKSGPQLLHLVLLTFLLWNLVILVGELVAVITFIVVLFDR